VAPSLPARLAAGIAALLQEGDPGPQIFQELVKEPSPGAASPRARGGAGAAARDGRVQVDERVEALRPRGLQRVRGGVGRWATARPALAKAIGARAAALAAGELLERAKARGPCCPGALHCPHLPGPGGPPGLAEAALLALRLAAPRPAAGQGLGPSEVRSFALLLQGVAAYPDLAGVAVAAAVRVPFSVKAAVEGLSAVEPMLALPEGHLLALKVMVLAHMRASPSPRRTSPARSSASWPGRAPSSRPCRRSRRVGDARVQDGGG
jgi:hypothetical protein